MSVQWIWVVLILVFCLVPVGLTETSGTDDEKFLLTVNATHKELSGLITSFGNSVQTFDPSTIRSSASAIFDLTYQAKTKIKSLSVSPQYEELKTKYLQMLTDYNLGTMAIKQAMDQTHPQSSNFEARSTLELANSLYIKEGDSLYAECTNILQQVK